MKLWQYSGNRLKITAIDGSTFTGMYDHYTSELDNPDGIATISLRPDHNPDRILIEFEESEIAEIEIIPALADVV